MHKTRARMYARTHTHTGLPCRTQLKNTFGERKIASLFTSLEETKVINSLEKQVGAFKVTVFDSLLRTEVKGLCSHMKSLFFLDLKLNAILTIC